MATSASNVFALELDTIAARYESQFSGQSRATRNLDEIDAIIADTESVVARVQSIPLAVAPQSIADLAETARENLALYKNERRLIVEAKNAPPEAEAFAPLAASANLVFSKYARHFAGQSRGTRDVGLLAELVDELANIRERMIAVAGKKPSATFKTDIDLVTSTAAMYESEIKQIEIAYKSGTSEERASMLANRANAQFKLYQDHFAGHARATRRPALLVRMIEQLEAIQDDMQALADGGLVGSNSANIRIVEEQLTMFRSEIAEVRLARKGASLADLMGMLGGAANDVMAQYREHFAGHDRKTRDADLLSVICDRLGEVRKQMDDLGRAENNADNVRNLGIVTEQLSSFEREHELILQAKRGN